MNNDLPRLIKAYSKVEEMVAFLHNPVTAWKKQWNFYAKDLQDFRTVRDELGEGVKRFDEKPC